MSEKDKLLDHDYDGIQEYDNDLPIWWRNIFIITTVFAVGYAIYVHGGYAETPHDRLARELSELDEMQSASSSESSSGGEGMSLDDFVVQQASIDAGKVIFTQNCVACHGAQGEGIVGPNLTDKFWIHGGGVNDIYMVIKEGVIEKGMIAWKAMLTPDQLKEVTAYVWSIRNNEVAGKEPQGEPVN